MAYAELVRAVNKMLSRVLAETRWGLVVHVYAWDCDRNGSIDRAEVRQLLELAIGDSI